MVREIGDYASIGAIALVLVYMLLVIILFGQDLISSSFANILMQGAVSMGTILLASITWMTLRQNQKDRQKRLQRELIEEVIRPAINTLDGNAHAIQEDNISWLRLDLDRNHLNPHRFTLWQVRSSAMDHVAFLRFGDEYPRLKSKIEQYDKDLNKLHQIAEQIGEKTHDEIERVIEKEVDEGSINTKIVIECLLNDSLPQDSTQRLNLLWNNHYNELKAILECKAEDEWSEFTALRTEIVNSSSTLREELEQARREIRRQHEIVRNEIEVKYPES